VARQAQRHHAGLRPPRILILSASIGAGHDLPAEVLAAELRERAPGAAVEIADSLRASGPLLEAIAAGGSSFDTRFGNAAFDVEHRLVMQWPPGRRFTSAVVTRIAGNRIGALVERAGPDVIVSTYPGATEVLGRMRLDGRLRMPLVSAITDLSSLWWWAHPGVDVHLITHPESAAEVRSIAGAHTVVESVRGLNDPAWAVSMDVTDARRALGLPLGPRLVVVSGGGWGVGDLEGAVEESLARENTMVVVLCGTNDGLRDRLGARFAGAADRVQIWGFTDRMPELFAAADALIHSTAGLTVLEALMRGLPAISYGWGVGHIRLNNEAYARFGLADVATTRAELGAALDRALAATRAPDPSFAALPTAAEVVLRCYAEHLLDAA
jgi:processive 1,2-diacylglycerol beta-glucosyltransferase